VRKAFFIGLFAVALLWRLTIAAVLFAEFGPALYFQGNEPSQIAVHLESGDGFSSPYNNVPVRPTAQQPPVYPSVLAVLFRLCGAYSSSALVLAILLNALAGAFTAILIARAGSDLPWGWLAACAWALLPTEVIPAMVLGNNALSALVVAFVLNYRWNAVVSGIVYGLSMLLNPNLGMIFVASEVALSWEERTPQVRRWLSILALSLAVLSPWIIRNYRVFGQFIPLRDNFGMELWLGNREDKPHATVSFDAPFPSADPAEYIERGEVRFMQEKGRAAWQFIRREPRQFFGRVARRVWEFWNDGSGIGLLIGAAAWYGSFKDARRGKMFCLLVLILAPAVYYVTHFSPNYRHPIEPVVLLAAATALPTRPFTQA
jgi:hypothetical protein